MTNTYQVIGTVSNTDQKKTIIVEGPAYTEKDAMDYAAMFHSIDEIESIKQGSLRKGIFFESGY
ncbi:MAG: hypothetical protein V4560_15070 [Bacteroidota bacterium]